MRLLNPSTRLPNPSTRLPNPSTRLPTRVMSIHSTPTIIYLSVFLQLIHLAVEHAKTSL